MTEWIDWPEFERCLREEIALSNTIKDLDILYRGSRAILDKAKTSYSLYHSSLIDLFKKRKEEIRNNGIPAAQKAVR